MLDGGLDLYLRTVNGNVDQVLIGIKGKQAPINQF